jgi:hypothetical protein
MVQLAAGTRSSTRRVSVDRGGVDQAIRVPGAVCPGAAPPALLPPAPLIDDPVVVDGALSASPCLGECEGVRKCQCSCQRNCWELHDVSSLS